MPSKFYRKTYYFDTDTFIDIVHDIEQIPERPQPRNDFVAQTVTIAQLDRWRRVFGLDPVESRLIIADTRADAFVKCEPSEEEYGVEKPKDVGAMISKAAGEWELFVKDDVDDYVSRLSCVPDIERKNGIYIHSVTDEKENFASVIVLRMWEAALLRDSVPPGMRYGRYIYYTGSWGSLSLAWARKDLRGPDVQKEGLLQYQPLGSTLPRPLQDKYPIWYFLTGHIARPDKLKALWKLDKKPWKRHAYVTGLTTINHINRNAPVIIPGKDDKGYKNRCVGVAYLVKDKLAENRLRYFKTDYFNVVNCGITLQPLYKHGKRHKVNGLTFVLTESALETMAEPVFAPAVGHSDAADFERRTGNLEYLESNVASMEPSLAFDGSVTLGLEEAILKKKYLADESVMVYPFPRLKEGRSCSGHEHRARIETIRHHGRMSQLANVTNASEILAPPSSTPDTRENNSASGSSGSPAPSGGNRHISWSDVVIKDSIAWWDQPLGISITSHTEGSSGRMDEDRTVAHIEELGSGDSSGEDEVMANVAASEATNEIVEPDSSTPELIEPISTTAATGISNASRIDEAASEPLGADIPIGEGNLSLSAIDAGEWSSTMTDGTDGSSSTLVTGEIGMPNSALEDILNILVDVVLSFFLYRLQRVLDATTSEAAELDEFEDDGINGEAR